MTNQITSAEVKITGSGVISAIPRGTERGSESRALPRTAGSLAASHILRGFVRVAAGDVTRVVGVCEGVVKEIHRGDNCFVPWTIEFDIGPTNLFAANLLNRPPKLASLFNRCFLPGLILAFLFAFVYLLCWFLLWGFALLLLVQSQRLVLALFQ